MRLEYVIDGDNFDLAGEATSDVKRHLTKLGVFPADIKRTVIAMYEAEINAFIHGGGGEASIEIDSQRISIIIKDYGKGIEDLELAMQEGWSTADESIKRLGFGAGMGLPNMKKNADSLEVYSEVNKGTEVHLVIELSKR